jgi:D-alanyl-lipoteichoic acid acyltransferase DltB (MBOAT superfamily)
VQTTSAPYFAFIAAAFFVYWAASRSRILRLAIICFANVFFCSRFGVFYVVLIPAAASIDFFVGLGLMRFRRSFVRRLLLGISLILNVGLLVGSRHMGAILEYARPAEHWDWIFPLGLSFYTFQALTYTIDLYRRDAEGTRSILAHLVSVSFFPTLLAGPITRVAELVKQFERDPNLEAADGGRAFFLIGLGLLKKFLIADYLAENLVNRVFDTPDLYSGFEVLVAVFAYSLQLYYDFSGYTDIARGAGQLFGVKLPINFDRPYLSLDIAEFWRRWHISFSSWLRDYLFYALPGNRTKVMPYLNLIVTMVIGGLWHGLTWNFAIWGLLHGVALAFVRGWQTWRGRWKSPVPWYKQAPAVALTYVFVCFTWIFFRSGTLDQALSLLRRIGSLSFSASNLSPAIGGVLLVAVAGCLVTKKMYASAIDFFSARPVLVHAVALALIALAIESLGGRGSAPFVYSRF